MRSMERTNLHVVGGTSRSRAEQARIAFALGHHAEVYADPRELIERAPASGIILICEPGQPGGVGRLIDQLGEGGVWHPVVVVAETIELERVVSAIRAGALDYIALPLEMTSFARHLEAILAEARPYELRRRAEVEARRRVGRLSRREREVLALLSGGRTNKEIALDLNISPRTVEIHRANMMTKLDACHAAEAVKAWIASGLERPVRLEPTASTANVTRLPATSEDDTPGPLRQRQ